MMTAMQYADALYHCEPVAEARRRAAWEVQIREEMEQATTCITDRQCPICFEVLGADSSSGTVCQLACGDGTHCFHAVCAKRWLAGSSTCPNCKTEVARKPLPAKGSTGGGANPDAP